jgi:hypothetical protein
MRITTTALLLTTICACATVAQLQKPAEHPSDLSLTAIGRQHHAIDTKNKDAQAYFDQSLTFIYGFNHEEASAPPNSIPHPPWHSGESRWP